jgi:hypothetical protein
MNMPAPTVDREQYRRLRAILRRHHTAVTQLISTTLLTSSARKLDVLEGRNLLLEGESELTIFFDYCLYSRRSKGRNVIDRYLAKLPPTDDPEEQMVRAAMAQDRYSMFRVEAVRQGVGFYLYDLVRHDTLFVVDEMFSQTIKRESLLGGRLLPLPQYWITSGSSFPLSIDVAEMIDDEFIPKLRAKQAKEPPTPDDAPPTASARLSDKAHEDLATVVIASALVDGTTSHVRYT